MNTCHFGSLHHVVNVSQIKVGCCESTFFRDEIGSALAGYQILLIMSLPAAHVASISSYPPTPLCAQDTAFYETATKLANSNVHAHENESVPNIGQSGNPVRISARRHNTSTKPDMAHSKGVDNNVPLFSRRTREYLAAKPAGELWTKGSNAQRGATNSDTQSSTPKSEREEERRNKKEDISNLRHRRRTRSVPSAHRSRTRAGTETATPMTSRNERNVPAVGGTTPTGRSGAAQAGGGAGSSGALGRGKTSAQAVVGTTGASVLEQSETEGLSTGDAHRTGVRSGEGYQSASAVKTTTGQSAGGKPGRRRSSEESHNREESKGEALHEAVGDGMGNVSLTTSVEITVLNGMSVGEERDRKANVSDGVVGGNDETTCCSAGHQQGASPISDGLELPPLKQQQPRGSTAGMVHAADAHDGAAEKVERGAGRAADRSSSAAEPSVSKGRSGTRTWRDIDSIAGPTWSNRRRESCKK